MLPVVILAGGLASRIRPITKTIPKAMIVLGGKPFVDWQLSYLANQGISDVVICSGYLSEQIENYVGAGKKFGLNIKFSRDGEVLLGTGGAIKKAIPFLGDSFFVLYGDSFLPIDFKSVESSFFYSKRLGLMTVLKNHNKWDKSNVEFVGGKIIEYNKIQTHSRMNYIDYGLGVLQASVFDAYSESIPFDLSDIYHQLSINQQLEGCEVYQRFYEIGSFQGIIEAEQYFLNYNESEKS